MGSSWLDSRHALFLATEDDLLHPATSHTADPGTKALAVYWYRRFVLPEGSQVSQIILPCLAATLRLPLGDILASWLVRVWGRNNATG
jgi:hypothetical protein